MTTRASDGAVVVERRQEQEWLSKAQQGDKEAFAMLYRANVQPVYRYIAYRVGDAQTAEDLTAEVFLRAVKALPGYTDQGRPFIAWLYRIAHARVVDHYRRQNSRPHEGDLDSLPLAVQPDMDAGMLREEAASALRAALRGLTAEQQHILILRFIEGYRIDAVARLVGKTPNAVKAMQHRALRALAKRLDEAGFEGEQVIAGLS